MSTLDSIRILLLKVLGPSQYEKLIFFMKNGYWPNLETPRSFNEIIASRKLMPEIPGMRRCADKLAVRQLVEERVGSDYLTVLHDTVYKEGISLDRFLNWPAQFVLKSNFGSGKQFIKIVKDKETQDWNAIDVWIKHSVQQTYGVKTNETWYMEIEPKCVLVEELLNPSGKDLRDYKFFMLHQKLLFIQVDQNRFTNHTRTLFSENWQKLDYSFGYPIGSYVDPPEKLNEMKAIASTLSSGFDFCRVDLYEDEMGRVKFGEITFSPDAGWGKFPERVRDYELGEHLQILFNKS